MVLGPLGRGRWRIRLIIGRSKRAGEKVKEFLGLEQCDGAEKSFHARCRNSDTDDLSDLHDVPSHHLAEVDP
jgi:hypothetical protein